MEPWVQTVVAVLCTFVASTGFWTFMQKRADTKDGIKEMLIGLGHDRIMCLGMRYIERGWISQEEYENLHEYLYIPYQKIHGNGSAKRIMQCVDTLPIRKYDPDMEGRNCAI